MDCQVGTVRQWSQRGNVVDIDGTEHADVPFVSSGMAITLSGIRPGDRVAVTWHAGRWFGLGRMVA